MTAKKSVLKLSTQDEKIRKKAFVKVSGFQGVNSITVDDKTKWTVVGEVDIAIIVKKLRKICNAEIVSVEDVKPPEKKSVPKEVIPERFEDFVRPIGPIQYYQYQYSAPYADYYYQQPCTYATVLVQEPSPCVIM